jgi:hypothetical protein
VGQTKEIIVKFESLAPSKDRRDFCSTLADVFHIGVYLEGPFSTDSQYCKFFLRPLSRNTQSAAQFIDVIAEHTKLWLQDRKTPSSVELYSADGDPIQTIDNRNIVLSEPPDAGLRSVSW